LKAQQRQLDTLVGERTSALQAALETRDEFLQTLAHDLKTPIASVAWHVQLLIRRAHEGGLDSSPLEEGLKAIAIGASQAVAAIDELHDLTRLAAGSSLPLHRTAVDLVALARRAVSARAESSQGCIHFESSEAHVIVDGDPGRLARMLDNLLDNASKYGSPDEPGTVSVERSDVEGIAWAVVSVQDHGLGIAPVDLPRIFERHYRGQNVATIDGEGLGLASVRRLIHLHGGSVEVRSELGFGSTFTVTFPLCQPDHAHNPRALRSHLRCLNGSTAADDDHGLTKHGPAHTTKRCEGVTSTG
jgi:signal transduction histidine kinase